jgi:prepilin signal peptidase PulO-like enzyme (type II secretory pathway)
VAGAILLGAVVAGAKGADPYRGLLGVGYLAVLALLAVGDVQTRRAPNRIVYPALAVAVVSSLLLGQAGAIEALLGAAAAFLVMLIVALLGRGAMGYGDVKVGALCGLAVGLHGVVPLLVITALSSAAVAGVLLALRIRKRTDSLPFVPFLAGAAALSMTSYPLYLWG